MLTHLPAPDKAPAEPRAVAIAEKQLVGHLERQAGAGQVETANILLPATENTRMPPHL
jgi:hypothetical protein